MLVLPLFRASTIVFSNVSEFKIETASCTIGSFSGSVFESDEYKLTDEDEKKPVSSADSSSVISFCSSFAGVMSALAVNVPKRTIIAVISEISFTWFINFLHILKLNTLYYYTIFS